MPADDFLSVVVLPQFFGVCRCLAVLYTQTESRLLFVACEGLVIGRQLEYLRLGTQAEHVAAHLVISGLLHLIGCL